MIPIAPEARFLDCVHCGLCLTACPTYVTNGLEADSPRGRIYLMKALQDGRLRPTAETVRHLDLCLDCRACETACPSGVRYGALIESARPAVESRYRRPWLGRVRRAAIAGLLARPQGQHWLAFGAAVLPHRPLAAIARSIHFPNALRYWAAMAAVLPRPASVAVPTVLEPESRLRGVVTLLKGCIAHTFFGSTNLLAARLLAHAGLRVHTPADPVCCGALLLHLGRRSEAVDLARRTAELLRPMAVDAVVTTAAGCGAMLQAYGEILDDASGTEIATRARDVTTVLAQAGFPTPPRRIDRTVTYHDPCHLAHAQGVREAPRALLRAIPGLELIDLPEADMCCGSAGTYNVAEPRMSRRLMLRKTAHILRTGAAVVATPNPGCLLQLRAGLLTQGAPVTAVHPLDLLAEAHLPQPV